MATRQHVALCGRDPLSVGSGGSLGGGGQQAGLKNREKINPVGQWSPAFSAPGTNFIEDNFSMDHE